MILFICSIDPLFLQTKLADTTKSQSATISSLQEQVAKLQAERTAVIPFISVLLSSTQPLRSTLLASRSSSSRMTTLSGNFAYAELCVMIVT